MSTDLANRIQMRLNDLNKSARAASLEAGLSDAFVLNILKGKSESPRVENLQKLAGVLNVGLEWLLSSEGAAQSPTNVVPFKAEYRPPADTFSAKDVPVYAAAEGGKGEMVVTTEAIDFTFRPEYLLHVKDAYAVLITGTSMEPRYEAGEKVYVHPRAPLVRGKDVILCSDAHGGDFRALIKRLVRWTDSQWYVRQYNPDKEFWLPKSEWRKAFRVFGRMDI